MIVSKTSYGNYEIKDPTGTTKVVPLHKLKVIGQHAIDLQESEEIKLILDHRTSDNGTTDYLVEWASGDISWVNETKFNQFELINDYRNGKPKPKRGRPPKDKNPKQKIIEKEKQNKKITNIAKEPTRKSTRLLNLSPITCIVLLCFILPLAAGLQLNDKFMYCDIQDNAPYWDETNECKTKEVTVSIEAGEYVLLNKLHDKVSGDGY